METTLVEWIDQLVALSTISIGRHCSSSCHHFNWRLSSCKLKYEFCGYRWDGEVGWGVWVWLRSWIRATLRTYNQTKNAIMETKLHKCNQTKSLTKN